MNETNANKVMRFIEENDVKFIRLQFVDIFGQLKNVAITERHLSKALTNGVMFDPSAIDGFTGITDSDLYLCPDPETISIIPWRPQQGRVARIICDVKTADGSQFEGDPRYILKKVTEKAAQKGFTFHVGPECEFFLFHTDSEGQPTTKTHDTAGYFDMAPIDMGENTRREICLLLEEMDFNIESSHHEIANGQHVIHFEADDAINTADKIMTLKMVVKIVAQRNGLHATFMPKPISDTSGSGMHLNLSLYQNGQNIFATPSGELSPEAQSFASGILNHIKGITAITNPLVNSYKRLIPGYDAPVQIGWSTKNRIPLLRIPAVRNGNALLELRSPDPTCNPYLALALILSAGLDGLENNLALPPSIDSNITQPGDRLPATLYDALVEMQKDPLIQEVLGAHIYSQYLRAKKSEWLHYSATVHEWEREKYLTTF